MGKPRDRIFSEISSKSELLDSIQKNKRSLAFPENDERLLRKHEKTTSDESTSSKGITRRSFYIGSNEAHQSWQDEKLQSYIRKVKRKHDGLCEFDKMQPLRYEISGKDVSERDNSKMEVPDKGDARKELPTQAQSGLSSLSKAKTAE